MYILLICSMNSSKVSKRDGQTGWIWIRSLLKGRIWFRSDMVQIRVTDPHKHPQSNQSAGPVSFLIFCTTSIFLLASLVAGRKPRGLLVQISRECTPPYLSTGISNLLQPAQAEVVLGQRSTYLASWQTPLLGACSTLLQYCTPI